MRRGGGSDYGFILSEKAVVVVGAEVLDVDDAYEWILE